MNQAEDALCRPSPEQAVADDAAAEAQKGSPVPLREVVPSGMPGDIEIDSPPDRAAGAKTGTRAFQKSPATELAAVTGAMPSRTVISPRPDSSAGAKTDEEVFQEPPATEQPIETIMYTREGGRMKLVLGPGQHAPARSCCHKSPQPP